MTLSVRVSQASAVTAAPHSSTAARSAFPARLDGAQILTTPPRSPLARLLPSAENTRDCMGCSCPCSHSRGPCWVFGSACGGGGADAYARMTGDQILRAARCGASPLACKLVASLQLKKRIRIVMPALPFTGLRRRYIMRLRLAACQHVCTCSWW